LGLKIRHLSGWGKPWPDQSSVPHIPSLTQCLGVMYRHVLSNIELHQGLCTMLFHSMPMSLLATFWLHSKVLQLEIYPSCKTTQSLVAPLFNIQLASIFQLMTNNSIKSSFYAHHVCFWRHLPGFHLHLIGDLKHQVPPYFFVNSSDSDLLGHHRPV